MTGEELFDAARAEGAGERLPHDVVKRHFSIINKGIDRGQFVDRATHYLNEVNVLHPFREGNGRSQRAFMDHVAENAERAFQWSKVSPKEMLDASIHGYAVDTSKLKDVLDKALIELLKKRP